jgi:hypothetical protein
VGAEEFKNKHFDRITEIQNAIQSVNDYKASTASQFEGMFRAALQGPQASAVKSETLAPSFSIVHSEPTENTPEISPEEKEAHLPIAEQEALLETSEKAEALSEEEEEAIDPEEQEKIIGEIEAHLSAASDISAKKEGAAHKVHEFYVPVLRALNAHDGAAFGEELLNWVAEKYDHLLTEEDKKPSPSRPEVAKWRLNARIAKQRMMKAGWLAAKKHSKLWRITEAGSRKLRELLPSHDAVSAPKKEGVKVAVPESQKSAKNLANNPYAGYAQPGSRIPSQQRLPDTFSYDTLKEPIMNYLLMRGGRAQRQEVFRYLEVTLALSENDLLPHPTNTYMKHWMRECDIARMYMIKEGKMKKTGERGVWALTDRTLAGSAVGSK